MALPLQPVRPLPPSFARDGFVSADNARMEGRSRRRIMIGTDGPANSGKTEFILSAPGPGMVVCVDRGFDAAMDNPEPPPTRRKNFAFKVIKVPLAGTAVQNAYVDYWKAFYGVYRTALDNEDAITIGLDGDSDTWELQRLAEFGKLTQIPSILYTGVNAARRAMIARAWDSGKIIIATNKIVRDYQPKRLPNGEIEMKDGKEVRVWDGKSYDRQGFNDQDYLWHIQLRHLYRPGGINRVTGLAYAQSWGIKIMMCKANRALEGEELWGKDCNFKALVNFVYPHVPDEQWGL